MPAKITPRCEALRPRFFFFLLFSLTTVVRLSMDIFVYSASGHYHFVALTGLVPINEMLIFCHLLVFLVTGS